MFDGLFSGHVKDSIFYSSLAVTATKTYIHNLNGPLKVLTLVTCIDKTEKACNWTCFQKSSIIL